MVIPIPLRASFTSSALTNKGLVYVAISALLFSSLILPTYLLISACVALKPISLKYFSTSAAVVTLGLAQVSIAVFDSASVLRLLTNCLASSSVGFVYPAFLSMSLASASVVVFSFISLLIASVFSAKDLPFSLVFPSAILVISLGVGNVSNFLTLAASICFFNVSASGGGNVTSILVAASRRIVLLPTVNTLYTRSLVKSFT